MGGYAQGAIEPAPAQNRRAIKVRTEAPEITSEIHNEYVFARIVA